MADIAKLSTGVRPADIPISQLTTRLAETMAAGDVARLDATNGTFTGANASAVGEAALPTSGTSPYAPHGGLYILLNGGVAGESVTGVNKGKIAGLDVSALNFGANVYLSNTDKALADAAGTVAVTVGRVIPGTASGTVPFDKIVEVG